MGTATMAMPIPGRVLKPGHSSYLEAQATFFEADKSLVADDKMVEHFYAQQSTGLGEGASYLDILRRGSGITRGMIVGYN